MLVSLGWGGMIEGHQVSTRQPGKGNLNLNLLNEKGFGVNEWEEGMTWSSITN